MAPRTGKLVHILEGFDMSTAFPKVRTTYNFDAAAWSDFHGLKCEDPSLAVQSQKDEADINTIVRNFGITGKLPESVRVPMYGDFEGIEDYREALHAIKEAEASFLAMPSDLRNRLDNDPQRFLEWCADSSNLEEMRKLGLAVPLPPDDKASA